MTEVLAALLGGALALAGSYLATSRQIKAGAGKDRGALIFAYWAACREFNRIQHEGLLAIDRGDREGDAKAEAEGNARILEAGRIRNERVVPMLAQIRIAHQPLAETAATLALMSEATATLEAQSMNPGLIYQRAEKAFEEAARKYLQRG